MGLNDGEDDSIPGGGKQMVLTPISPHVELSAAQYLQTLQLLFLLAHLTCLLSSTQNDGGFQTDDGSLRLLLVERASSQICQVHFAELAVKHTAAIQSILASIPLGN